MREYMLLILNQIDHQKDWPKERHLQFIKSCENYIGELKKGGHLIAAQPLAKEGLIVSGNDSSWREESLRKTGEVQVGYYHILADSIAEAIILAKDNPEFQFSSTARIEVRPIKSEEKETGFVYPK